MLTEDVIKNKYGPIKYAALRNNNKIYIGTNHAQCFIQEPKGILRNAEQGFVTDTGLFVDRYEALVIATFYKQIKYKHEPKDMLFSEDIFN